MVKKIDLYRKIFQNIYQTDCFAINWENEKRFTFMEKQIRPSGRMTNIVGKAVVQILSFFKIQFYMV